MIAMIRGSYHTGAANSLRHLRTGGRPASTAPPDKLVSGHRTLIGEESNLSPCSDPSPAPRATPQPQQQVGSCARNSSGAMTGGDIEPECPSCPPGCGYSVDAVTSVPVDQPVRVRRLPGPDQLPPRSVTHTWLRRIACTTASVKVLDVSWRVHHPLDLR